MAGAATLRAAAAERTDAPYAFVWAGRYAASARLSRSTAWGGLPTTKGWRLIPRERGDAAPTPVPGAAAEEAAAAVAAAQAAATTARSRAVVVATAVPLA